MVSSALPKANLLIAFDGRLIVIQHTQRDAVHIQVVKPKSHQKIHGLGAVALTPAGCITDENSYPGRLVQPVEIPDATVADELISVQSQNAEMVLRAITALPQSGTLYLQAGDSGGMPQQFCQGKVVAPPEKRVGIFPKWGAR